MGCICTRNNICSITRLSSKNIISKVESTPNLSSKIKYNDNKKMKKKLSEYDIINSNNSIIAKSERNDRELSPKKEQKYETRDSKISKSLSLKYNSNDEKSSKSSMFEINQKQKKKKKNFKTNLFLRIPKEIKPKMSASKLNLSIQMLRNIAFEPLNTFDSLKNNINQNITFTIQPDYNEKMFNVWIDKNELIIFRFHELLKWGIKQKGLTNYKGYKEIFNGFNLCCVLMRVGNENNYNIINDKKPFFSKYEGPLFMKMNISKDEILKKNYLIEGELECEILNAKSFSACQILKKLNFKYNIDYGCFEILNLINIFRREPNKFLNLFFPCEKFDYLNFTEIDNNLINDNILKKISDEENILVNQISSLDKNYENYIIEKIKNYSGFADKNFQIKFFQIFTETKDSIVAIKKLIKENKYNFIFDTEFKYIGISVKEIQNGKNNDNVKFFFLISNILI